MKFSEEVEGWVYIFIMLTPLFLLVLFIMTLQNLGHYTKFRSVFMSLSVFVFYVVVVKKSIVGSWVHYKECEKKDV